METLTLFYTDHPGQFIWKLLPSSIQIIQNNSFGISYPLLYRSSRTIHLETLTLFYKIIQNNSFGNSNPSIQIIQDNSFGNPYPLLYRSFRTIHLETLTSSKQIIQNNTFGNSYFFKTDHPGQFIWKLLPTMYVTYYVRIKEDNIVLSFTINLQISERKTRNSLSFWLRLRYRVLMWIFNTMKVYLTVPLMMVSKHISLFQKNEADNTQLAPRCRGVNCFKPLKSNVSSSFGGKSADIRPIGGKWDVRIRDWQGKNRLHALE